MKVLMTTDCVGGVWTYGLDLARGLARHGVEVVLAAVGPAPDAEQSKVARALPNVRYLRRPYALEWMEDPWEDVTRAGEWLLGLERQHAPDVVHLNGYAHGALPFRAPKVVVAHSCVPGWWESVHGTDLPQEWDTYRRVVHRGLGGADLVVAPTHAMLEALRRHHGPFTTPCDVVPNGRDPEAFTSRKKEAFVLTVGRAWDAAKNLRVLNAAAADLAWPVEAVGDAASPAGTTQGPFHNLVHHGRVGDDVLRDRYARAAVYASPALYEPFGLGPLEAALSGCALALSDIPTLREVWGDAAAYAPPDDPAAWHDLLDRLIHDDGARRTLAGRARERGRHLTHHTMADGYCAHYRRLTRRTAPSIGRPSS